MNLQIDDSVDVSRAVQLLKDRLKAIPNVTIDPDTNSRRLQFWG